jgi:cysteine synthase
MTLTPTRSLVEKISASSPPPIAQDFTQAIGSVPIVRLNQVSPQCQLHNLYLKLESCNPGGSIKEKNAVCLINQAEAAGLLPVGGTIVESSSGNFGIALAMVGAVRGCTAGQIAGISRYFKQHYPHTKIIGVDVAGSAVFGTPKSPYKMTGLGLSFVPPNFDPSLIDVAYTVSDRVAFSFCHQIAQCEGLLLGASTDFSRWVSLCTGEFPPSLINFNVKSRSGRSLSRNSL